MNTLKTTFLMALLMVLAVTIGYFIGGNGGMMIAFVFALVMNLFSYWFSHKIVLTMYRAKPVTERSSRACTIWCASWRRRRNCRCQAFT